MAGAATQSFVPIQEVRDGIAVLKDGSMRAVVMASSVNFALKSLDEQQAILQQFQTFLNTLDFSIQIYVQSRELDIKPYLELLSAREPEQDNDLMKVQLREYMGFVEHFIEEVDIMTKNFFVVVPYSAAKINVKGAAALFGNKKSTAANTPSRFEEDRMQIEQRIGVVEQGLSRVGVRTVVLGTDEVVELFYHVFNPKERNRPPSV